MTQGGTDCPATADLVVNVAGTKVKGQMIETEGSYALSGTVDDEGRVQITVWGDEFTTEVVGTVQGTIITGKWSDRSDFCKGTFTVKKTAKK